MSTEIDVVVDEDPARYYRHSVLIAGLRGLGRAWLPLLIAVVVNALLQGLLTIPSQPTPTSWAFIGLGVVSLVVLLIAFAVITASALESVEGHVSFGAAMGRIRSHWLSFTIWTVLVIAAVMLGLLVYIVPGMIVAFLAVFGPLAAMDGRGDALLANLRAIGNRPGRWLITGLIMALFVGVAWLIAALSGFFVGGAAGSIVVWLVFGVIASWFQCAWAVLYRSTPPGTHDVAVVTAE